MLFPFILLAVAPTPPSGGGPRMRSPWDALPVPASMKRDYACIDVAAPPHEFSLEGYYADSRRSIVNPVAKRAYDAASGSIEAFTRAVAKASDAYRRTGGSVAAECALHMLTAGSKAGSLVEPQPSERSRQAFYVQAWMTAGLALAYLKVRDAATADQRSAIDAWLAELGAHVLAFQGRLSAAGAGDSQNNLHAWAGLAVAATGIAADRPALFAWGVQAGRDELMQVDADGILPLEIARGSKALHYHLFMAAPLVVLAELAQGNGTNLYSENGGALRRLVERTLSGIENPSFFATKSGAKQEMPDPRNGLTFSWAAPFERRFPSRRLAARLRLFSAEGYFMLGGLPPQARLAQRAWQSNPFGRGGRRRLRR